MLSCLFCSAPLDGEGFCTSCGALVQGFSRTIPLGTEQLEDAVERGLDFYRLLEVAPEADIYTIGRRYQQLRGLFPLDPAYLNSEQARRLTLLEVVGRVLTHPRLRATYDSLRVQRQATANSSAQYCETCGATRMHDAVVCPYCATPSLSAEIDKLLSEGRKHLEQANFWQASQVFQHVIELHSSSIEAHQGFVQSSLAAHDVLALGAYQLRLILNSLSALAAHASPIAHQEALTALCRGLLARDAGDAESAESELRNAVAHDSSLAAAWRSLAALLLARGAIEECVDACRRALTLNPRDERTLLLMLGAYLRAEQPLQAYEVATQVAQHRGRGWKPDAVMREIAG